MHSTSSAIEYGYFKIICQPETQCVCQVPAVVLIPVDLASFSLLSEP